MEIDRRRSVSFEGAYFRIVFAGSFGECQARFLQNVALRLSADIEISFANCFGQPQVTFDQFVQRSLLCGHCDLGENVFFRMDDYAQKAAL